MLKKNHSCFSIWALAIFCVSLLYYGYAAISFPTLFNLDNQYNYAATSYLAQNAKLPVVELDTPGVDFTDIGTTRSLRPPLTYIVSAVASNLSEPFIENPNTRQRLGSPLIAALTLVAVFVGFYLSFRHLGLAVAGVAIIACLPKFVFLASCNNDDIGAIFSVSLLFASVIALHNYGARRSILLALAASLGLVLQSKFTAWLGLPWLGLYCIYLLKSELRSILRLAPLLIAACVVFGGWWLIFNMWNYGLTDPTAMLHANELQRSLSDLEPNRQGYHSLGVGVTDLLINYDQFLTRSYTSLIGYLDWLELDLGWVIYSFYAAIFVLGIAGVFLRTTASDAAPKYLDYLVLVLLISQCAFYVHHNLVRDVQPQARYILPVLMPLVYLFLRFVDQCSPTLLRLHVNSREFGFKGILSVVVTASCLALYVHALTTRIAPSFQQQAYYTTVRVGSSIDLKRGFQVLDAVELHHAFSDQGLHLKRLSNKVASVTFTPELCDSLPLNTILSVDFLSNRSGGIYIEIDRHNLGTFKDIYWTGFSEGNSNAIMSLNSKHCSGVRFRLAKNTQEVLIAEIQIIKLRIHQYGKPI